ncbi:MAG TPA: polyketide synthase dehydratase domain-containing protein, partial [Pyrinomonadaceae bacterium]
FKRAYHTPLFQPFAARLREFFQRMKIAAPQMQVYSCMTAQPYPADAAEIRRIAVEQWAQPVRFRETIEAMYEDGVRIFVEAGPKGNLTAFVDDILRGRSYAAMAANVSRHSGITQLNHLVGLLAAQRVPLQLEHLYHRRTPQRLSLEQRSGPTSTARHPAEPMRLALGLQPLRLKRESSNGGAKRPAAPASRSEMQVSTGSNGLESEPPKSFTSHPERTTPPAQVMPAVSHQQNGHRSEIMTEYLGTMERFLSLQHDIMQAFLNGTAASAPSMPEIQVSAVETPSPVENLPRRESATPQEQRPVEPHLEGSSKPAHRQSQEIISAHEVTPSAQEENDPAASTPDNNGRSPEAIGQTLLKLISEKTGYPVEMLDPAQNLEADLGVDSIKRVEILGAFQQQTGLLQAQEIDQVTGLKTLQQIIDFVAKKTHRNGQRAADLSAHAPAHDDAHAASSHRLATLPFIGSLAAIVPDRQELVTLRELDPDEDLYLRDHTLGGRVSLMDESLTALPIMPLTVSMEMMAEAAAPLFPDKLLVGMKEIRAYRWLMLDKTRTTLKLIARRKTTAAGEAEVQIRQVAHDPTHQTEPEPVIIEGTAIFDDDYPSAPAAAEFSLRAERPSIWSAENLYSKGMFHGPSFQGVVSLDRWGEDGTEATLKVLPTDRLLRSQPDPQFLFDPVLLDAAGQLVGYWTAEHLETGFNVFPFRVEALHLYGPNLPHGTLAKCRARIALVGESLVKSEIDTIAPDGRVHARLKGWEDKRFNLPDSFYRLRISPRDALLSKLWAAPLAQLPQPGAFVCCLLDELSDKFLEAHGRIWQHVLTHLVLNRRERESWQNMKGPEKRRNEWLRGRAAAKDAVRLFLKNRYGLQLCPADIEIVQDEYGRPLAQGDWTKELACLPVISLAHAGEVALALAGDGAQCDGVGVDVEPLGRVREGFESVAFTHEERGLLDAQDDSLREEHILRLWCAKEAIAKALGRGMIGGPGGLTAKHFEAHTGIVTMALSGEMAKQFNELGDMRLTAYTAREGNLIVASSFYQRS